MLSNLRFQLNTNTNSIKYQKIKKFSIFRSQVRFLSLLFEQETTAYSINFIVM